MSRFALEPIETASIDELRALQLKRLQGTLRRWHRRHGHEGRGSRGCRRCGGSSSSV